MTGLLGNGWEDPKSQAIMALSAGLLGGSFRQGLVGAGNAFAEAKQRALEEQKLQAQLGLIGAQTAENQAQAEERRQKLELARRAEANQHRFLFGDAQAAPGGAPGLVGAGGAGPAGATQQGGLVGFARSLGIPEQAIQADVLFNGGKKIAELLAERSKPNWQNVNGNLVNTNAQGFQGGLQPGMSASSDGRVTAWQPDGQGGLVVGAPRGALETYGAYQGVGERAKAAMDPLPITPPGAGSNPIMRSRLSVMQEANLPAPQPGVRGNFVGDPAAVAASIAAIRDPQERANAQAAFEAQMRSSGGIPMQSPAEATKAEVLARAGAERETTETNKASQFKDFRSQLGLARTLLNAGPTESGAGVLTDQALGFFGMSTPGGVVGQSLETAAKWLSQNIPKAPGAQSDAELKEYQGAAGLVGDNKVPVRRRLAALDTAERLINTWEHRRALAGNAGAPGGADAAWDDNKPKAPQMLDTLPKTAPKGQKVRDTQTGKVLQFNGLSWVEVK